MQALTTSPDEPFAGLPPALAGLSIPTPDDKPVPADFDPSESGGNQAIDQQQQLETVWLSQMREMQAREARWDCYGIAMGLL